MNRYQIVKEPLKTERTGMMRQYNRYAFVVDPRANKIEIKKAVEELFNVHVTEIRTMNVRGKFRRLGVRSGGRKSDWKKAIVTLKEGENIPVLEA
jgi:large subunit ribosomal protein L23